MPLNTGDKFGPYEIVSPLGAGGMGEVYRARDTRLGRDLGCELEPENWANRGELRNWLGIGALSRGWQRLGSHGLR